MMAQINQQKKKNVQHTVKYERYFLRMELIVGLQSGLRDFHPNSFALRCLTSIRDFLLDIVIFRFYTSHSAEVLRFWSKIFDHSSKFPGLVFMEGSMYRNLQQIGARVAFTCLYVFVPTFGPKLGIDCQTEFPRLWLGMHHNSLIH